MCLVVMFCILLIPQQLCYGFIIGLMRLSTQEGERRKGPHVPWWIGGQNLLEGPPHILEKKTYFVQLTQGLARNPTCFALIYVARRGTGWVACLGGRGFERQF